MLPRKQLELPPEVAEGFVRNSLYVFAVELLEGSSTMLISASSVDLRPGVVRQSRNICRDNRFIVIDYSRRVATTDNDPIGLLHSIDLPGHHEQHFARRTPAQGNHYKCGHRPSLPTNLKFPATMVQPAGPICRETGCPGRSHSANFDHRRRPEMLRTAMATAFFCPTNTTSRFPRVTPV